MSNNEAPERIWVWYEGPFEWPSVHLEGPTTDVFKSVEYIRADLKEIKWDDAARARDFQKVYATNEELRARMAELEATVARQQMESIALVEELERSRNAKQA